MKKLNLCLHAGGFEVSRDALEMVPTPQATATWQPVPHAELVSRVSRALVINGGLEIVNESHAIAKEGKRYFGLLQVACDHSDYGLIVGVRNSHDKSFPAGLALGSGVFVCDNLSFSGEVTLARKHTANIHRDLPGLVSRAVARLTEHRGRQDERISAYKALPLTDSGAHDFLVRALDADVIGPCALPHVLREWRTPQHDDFQPRTGWSLFNAFTEILKGDATKALPRTQKLHGLMDSVCGIAV